MIKHNEKTISKDTKIYKQGQQKDDNHTVLTKTHDKETETYKKQSEKTSDIHQDNNCLYTYSIIAENDTYKNNETDSQIGGNQEKNDMNLTLDEYKIHLAVKHRKKHTQQTYHNAVKMFLEYTKGTITKETINDYLIHLNRKYRRNTITTYVNGLNTYLKNNDMQHLVQTVPRQERIHRDTITKEEITKMLRYAQKNNIQEYLILRFITDFDCRPHEIMGSKWENIKGDKIYFQDMKTGNTYGFIPEDLQTILRDYHKTQPKNTEYIFTNQLGRYRGQPCSMTGWRVREIISRISKNVIGRCLHPQDFRASVMTEEFNNYINPEIIRLKARHKDIKTTLMYNHAGEKQTQEYVAKGTIFGKHNRTLSKPDSENGEDIRSYIKTLPQDQYIQKMGEENQNQNNSVYSFSISSFFETNVMDGDAFDEFEMSDR